MLRAHVKFPLDIANENWGALQSRIELFSRVRFAIFQVSTWHRGVERWLISGIAKCQRRTRRRARDWNFCEFLRISGVVWLVEYCAMALLGADRSCCLAALSTAYPPLFAPLACAGEAPPVALAAPPPAAFGARAPPAAASLLLAEHLRFLQQQHTPGTPSLSRHCTSSRGERWQRSRLAIAFQSAERSSVEAVRRLCEKRVGSCVACGINSARAGGFR